MANLLKPSIPFIYGQLLVKDIILVDDVVDGIEFCRFFGTTYSFRNGVAANGCVMHNRHCSIWPTYI